MLHTLGSLLPSSIRSAASMLKLTALSKRRMFRDIGEGTLRHLKGTGGLQPDEHVLEVGCGYGRIALPLTRYLSATGHYEGFDIIRGEIQWAQKKITTVYPNFRFQHADVQNKYYNPNGMIRASEYRFPYADDTFDFVYLTSVFTHMLRHDMEAYLSEIARVLKTGGRCLITYFIYSQDLSDDRVSGSFPYPAEGCLLRSQEMPEWEVAFSEEDVRRLYTVNRLDLQEPIRYGDWSGRQSSHGLQDVIVAVKR